MIKNILIFIVLCTVLPVCAQDLHKPVRKFAIDSNAYSHWPTVSDAQIANDGTYACYQIENQPLGGSTTVFVSVDKKWQLTIPLASNVIFTNDGREAIFMLPGDSLTRLTLGKSSFKHIFHVKSYKVPKTGSGDWLIYQQDLQSQAVVVHNLTTNNEQAYPDVLDYTLSDNGNILLIHSKKPGSVQSVLGWINLENGKKATIWQGENCFNYSFDRSGNQLAFIAEKTVGAKKKYSIWSYPVNASKAVNLVSDDLGKIRRGFSLSNRQPTFNKDGSELFFTLQEDSIANSKVSDRPGVNIWNYKDEYLQSEQLSSSVQTDCMVTAVVNISGGKIQYLHGVEERLTSDLYGIGNFLLLTGKFLHNSAYYRNEDRPSLYLESVADGSRILLVKNGDIREPIISPNERYVLWFDQDSLAYFSYDISTKIKHNLSRNVPASLYNEDAITIGKAVNWGIAGWSKDGHSVFFYDQCDVWKVDITGKEASINITSRTGRKQRVIFNTTQEQSGAKLNILDADEEILLSGFNTQTKQSGFWTLSNDFKSLPLNRIMDDHAYFIGRVGRAGYAAFESAGRPIKAANKNIYLVWRMNAEQSLNLFVTSDFKTFKPLSNVYPEKQYNWLISELVTWKMTDGRYSQGILYKPENFDPTKKYPLIFDFYEKRSDELHKFIVPGFSHGRIDVPTFVSNGYLVFVPDIYYTPGHNGDGAVNSVVSAAKYLSKLPYVDSTKIGLQGHSFGGYETNYLITHSNLFAAAACEAAGLSDVVSAYGMILYEGGSDRYYYETGGQASAYGVGVTPWTRPDLYMQNSPVFSIGKVTTPLLMMHNTNDTQVQFGQAMEFFTGLERAGKKVWLLQYDRGDHEVEGEDAKDYTLRLQQFFDHYLKGYPPPKWMTKGIPAVMKNKETGYELDPNGSCGDDCPICKKKDYTAYY